MISIDFQSDEHVQLSSDILKIIYSGVHSSWERHFRTSDGMSSGLRLNSLGSLHINLGTSSGEKLMFDMFSSGKVPSSLVNTHFFSV